MLLGIDVGGTHTDGVAIDLEADAKVVTSCKVITRHDDLLSSVTEALETILAEVDKSSVTQLNLSTTLSTNAIVQGKTEDVGVIVSAGPGVDPHNFMPCRDFHVIDGSIDHRGNEVRALSTRQLTRAIDSCRDNGVRVFASVGNSPRAIRVMKISSAGPCASAGTMNPANLPISSRSGISSAGRSIFRAGLPRLISIVLSGGCTMISLLPLKRRWTRWGWPTSR